MWLLEAVNRYDDLFSRLVHKIIQNENNNNSKIFLHKVEIEQEGTF